jgi:transcription elongation GreA/GreB family factor
VISDMSRTETEAASILYEELAVQVGDRVLVSFSDYPGRQHTIVVRAHETDAPLGIYAIDHPAGKPLAGRMVDDGPSVPMENGPEPLRYYEFKSPRGSRFVNVPLVASFRARATNFCIV